LESSIRIYEFLFFIRGLRLIFFFITENTRTRKKGSFHDTVRIKKVNDVPCHNNTNFRYRTTKGRAFVPEKRGPNKTIDSIVLFLFCIFRRRKKKILVAVWIITKKQSISTHTVAGAVNCNVGFCTFLDKSQVCIFLFMTNFFLNLLNSSLQGNYLLMDRRFLTFQRGQLLL